MLRLKFYLVFKKLFLQESELAINNIAQQLKWRIEIFVSIHNMTDLAMSVYAVHVSKHFCT